MLARIRLAKRIKGLGIGKRALLLPLCLTGLVWVGMPVSGQLSWDCRVEEAFLAGDRVAWLQLLIARERELGIKGSNDERFSLALAYYGYTANLIEEGRLADARVYLEKTGHLLDGLESSGYRPSRVLALRATLTAFGMALDRSRALVLGPRSFKFLTEALKADPDCPYARGEEGNSLYYRPAFVGGSYSKAALAYHRSATLLEKQGHQKSCDWYYLYILIQEYRAYQKSNQADAAKQVRDKLMRIDKRLPGRLEKE